MSISNLSAIINHHLMIQVMNTHLKGSKHCNPKRIYKWNLTPWARLLQRSNNTKTTTFMLGLYMVMELLDLAWDLLTQ